MLLDHLLQVQKLPSEFFTLQSMVTLTGATGVVFVVSNGIQRAFNFNPRWLALVIAQIITIVGVLMTNQTGVTDFFVGVVNGFLVYSTAVGANQITGKNEDKDSFESRYDRILSAARDQLQGSESVSAGNKPGRRVNMRYEETKRHFNSKWY